jgi:sugar/nucleoside kinase (ribokinase family)
VGQSLPFKFSELIENVAIGWEDIYEIPGGSGLNFCVFAQKEGYRPMLLSKVGKDTAGTFITNWLKTKNISTHRGRATDAPPVQQSLCATVRIFVR